jgi:hypothetical protein
MEYVIWVLQWSARGGSRRRDIDAIAVARPLAVMRRRPVPGSTGRLRCAVTELVVGRGPDGRPTRPRNDGVAARTTTARRLANAMRQR